MPKGRPYWTQERIIAAMQRHAAENDGEAPNSAIWVTTKAGKPPWAPRTRTVLRVFGTWRAGVEAAGLTALVRLPLTEDEIAEAIRLRKEGLDCIQIDERLGWPRHTTWRTLARKGVIVPAEGWSKERIIEKMREWVRLYGRPPSAVDWNLHLARRIFHPASAAEVEKRHKEDRWPATTVVQYHFGSWSAALKAAGFESNPTGGAGHRHRRRSAWGDAEVVAAIKAWAERHGKPPSTDGWKHRGPDRPCAATVIRRFGSWNAAIAAAGLQPRPQNQKGQRAPVAS